LAITEKYLVSKLQNQLHIQNLQIHIL
jgi:hypothetical protein